MSTLSRVLLILSASILFGFYPPAVRGAYADGANGVFIIMLTTFFRAVTMTGFCVATGKKFLSTKKDVKQGMMTGLGQAISVTGILGSLVFLPGPVTVIFLFTSTLMLLFFMWAKGELEMNRWLLTTTLMCLGGLTLVVDLWNTEASHEIVGYVLIMTGAIATATRLYMFGKFSKGKSPAVVGAETFICAFLFLCLLMFYQLPVVPQSTEGWGWVMLSAMSLSLGSFLMFYAIAQIGPFYFSLYNKLEPVFTAIFSVLLIGEVLSLSQYCGMVIVIGSLVAYQLWDHQRKKNR